MTQVTIDQAMQIALEHHRAGRLQQAEQLYRQMLNSQPNFAPAIHHLGLIAHQVGKNDIAVDLIGRAITLIPNDAGAHSNLGNALKAKGQLQEAIAAYRRSIALRPDFPEALSNLGVALKDSGRWDEAVTAYRQALGFRPDLAEVHSNLGNALKEQGELDPAIAAYRQAIALKPALSEVHNNLGNVLTDMGQPDEAVASCLTAIALKPDYAEAYNNLGNALKDQGKLDEALAAYRKAAALKPAAAEFGSNAVYTASFHPGYCPQEILHEAQTWARQYADPLAVHLRPHDNDPSPDRPLRVGYVSNSFRDHVVGRNVLPILENHDRRQFQIHCFSGVRTPDAMTPQFRQVAQGWHDTAGMNDADLAKKIRHEQIDILVDLNLHMAGTRLPVFAHKPAPVQVTWAGYPGTTGLGTIDYRLTDPYLDPPGQDDAFYSETSIRLPHSFWCFRPTPGTPEVNSLPALTNGFVTFGCLNNFCKVTAPALDLWARVLQSTARSRLLILSPHGNCRDQVLGRFQAAGIEVSRIEFIHQLPLVEYLGLYHRLDLALDPLPYTGHSTSLDAFWMGVPVVTLAGRTVAARAGVSIASNLGKMDLIAKTAAEYVHIATTLADDLPRLAERRATSRDRMRSSPLMDERQFTLDVEQAYRKMWRTWTGSGRQSVRDDR